MSEYLQIEVEHTLGDISLRILCALSAPWTVLFGPSAAGKTSLLRVLAGLTRPARGRVVLFGRTLTDTERQVWVSPAERGIGFVSQRPALFPHLDVTANVSFALGGVGGRLKEERVAEMLGLFQAEHLAKRFPKDLSGGERQRVALARALVSLPRLMLLDEPFTGLDAELKAGILEPLMGWLGEREIPALYVSHDVAEAFETASDVLVMEDGRIVAHGPARLVLARQRATLLRQLDKD